jgi:hypothetical protein
MTCRQHGQFLADPYAVLAKVGAEILETHDTATRTRGNYAGQHHIQLL